MEMAESGILNYVKLEACTSRAQEIDSVGFLVFESGVTSISSVTFKDLTV